MEDTNRPQLAVNFHRCKDEGTVQVTILRPGENECILMSEEEFDGIMVGYTKFMQPIWEERADVRRQKTDAARKAAYVAAQKVVEIAGVKARLQYRVNADYSVSEHAPVTSVWLDGVDDEDASPFLIGFQGWMNSDRPYLLFGPVRQGSRRQIPGPKGGAMRFASHEAAFKKAIALGLHKVEEKAE